MKVIWVNSKIIQVYILMYICMYIHIDVYTEREREREPKYIKVGTLCLYSIYFTHITLKMSGTWANMASIF